MEKKDKKTKTCRFCKEEIAMEAKKCPKCGSKLVGTPWWVILLIILVVCIILASVSDSDSSSSESSKKKEGGSTKSVAEKFTLLDHKVSDESNEYFMYIEGRIKNNRDKDFSYVQVSFTTFDKEGNTIGTCLDNNSGLNANGTWKFKAICSDDVKKIDHYELKEITGW